MTRYFDAGFWSHHFDRVFVRQIRAFERALLDRVLPAFEGLEAEAEALAKEEYARLGRLPGRDDIDMADLAEVAHEVGLAHYEQLTSVRQSMLNLATAALFHLVEQQLLHFHRRQVLHPAEENDRGLFSWNIIHARFADGGVILRDLPCWPPFRELELVSNTVKHGDGRSADELRQVRPEILVYPPLRGDPRMGRPAGAVHTPLTGDSVHVTPEDFQRYAATAISFWNELASAIRRIG